MAQYYWTPVGTLDMGPGPRVPRGPALGSPRQMAAVSYAENPDNHDQLMELAVPIYMERHSDEVKRAAVDELIEDPTDEVKLCVISGYIDENEEDVRDLAVAKMCENPSEELLDLAAKKVFDEAIDDDLTDMAVEKIVRDMPFVVLKKAYEKAERARTEARAVAS